MEAVIQITVVYQIFSHIQEKSGNWAWVTVSWIFPGYHNGRSNKETKNGSISLPALWLCEHVWVCLCMGGLTMLFHTGWQDCSNIHNSLRKCNEVKCHNISHRRASLHFWQPDSAHQCRMCVCVCVFTVCVYILCEMEMLVARKKKYQLPPLSFNPTLFLSLHRKGAVRGMQD